MGAPATPVTTSAEGAPDPPGSRAGSPSLRPALFVIALAVLIVAGGTAIALVGTRSARQAPVAGLGRPVPGVSIRAVPALPVLRRISAGGEPPPDIVDNLTLPAGSRFVSKSGSASPIDQFDRSVSVSVPAPSSAVGRFYLAELSRAKWVLLSDTSSPEGRTYIAERAGTDGYEWLAGITVTDTSSTVSPALAGADRTGASSRVEIRLEQKGDVA